jgi:hypothetical protein
MIVLILNAMGVSVRQVGFLKSRHERLIEVLHSYYTAFAKVVGEWTRAQ